MLGLKVALFIGLLAAVTLQSLVLRKFYVKTLNHLELRHRMMPFWKSMMPSLLGMLVMLGASTLLLHADESSQAGDVSPEYIGHALLQLALAACALPISVHCFLTEYKTLFVSKGRCLGMFFVAAPLALMAAGGLNFAYASRVAYALHQLTELQAVLGVMLGMSALCLSLNFFLKFFELDMNLEHSRHMAASEGAA